jgi:ribosome assembly protein 3
VKAKATRQVEPDSPEPIPAPAPKKEKKKSKSTPEPSRPESEDVDMEDAPSPAPAPTKISKSKPSAQPKEDFSAIYLRKIAAELADDLDKVREAQDFKANSVPMLIHALRQGESMFSVEERRRVVMATIQ